MRQQQVEQALADAGRAVHGQHQRPRGPLLAHMVAHGVAQLAHRQVLADQVLQQVRLHSLAHARRKVGGACPPSQTLVSGTAARHTHASSATRHT